MVYVKVMRSNTTEVSVDQLTDGEVLGANETLQLDLLGDFVEVNEDLVLVVQSVVEQDCLDVVLVVQEVVKLRQPVLLAHEEQTLALKALLGSYLLLCEGLRLLSSILIGALESGDLRINGLDISRHLELIENELLVKLRLDLTDDAGDLKALVLHV